MAFGTLGTIVWEAVQRLVFILYVLLIATLLIIPLLVAAAILVILDILVELVTFLTPRVKHRNLIDTFGQTEGPPGYVWRWFAWIYKNLQRAFFGHTGAFNWIPPILP